MLIRKLKKLFTRNREPKTVPPKPLTFPDRPVVPKEVARFDRPAGPGPHTKHSLSQNYGASPRVRDRLDALDPMSPLNPASLTSPLNPVYHAPASPSPEPCRSSSAYSGSGSSHDSGRSSSCDSGGSSYSSSSDSGSCSSSCD